MHSSLLVIRNLRRSPLRAGITILTVAILLCAFVFPRSLVDAQDEQIRQTPNNRVVTRPKLGWTGTLPVRYSDAIRELPGVKQACGSLWAGLKVPGKEDVFFGSNGIEPEPFISMHAELETPEEQKRAWLADERGAFVSAALAKQFGWSIGDRVTFESRQYPGKWEVNVSAIFKSTREGFGERNVWIHYDYLNRGLPSERQDKLGLISAEIHEPNQGGRIAAAIDASFASSPFQTLSLEDKLLTAANIGRFRAVLDAMDLVSYLILGIVMSIVGNTLAMNVRERTPEYGVMRAIGFGPGHLAFLVLGEAALLGVLGAVAGLLLSLPIVEGLVSRALREAFQFPPIEVGWRVALTALLMVVGLSVLAAAVPVLRLSRLRVTEALRRVG
jgi:putative ABC transport system permease protein